MGQDKKVIGGLAEIALRVNDLAAMIQFYHDVIGLELMRETEAMAFFKIAEGFKEHTTILALFDRKPKSSLPDSLASPSSSDSSKKPNSYTPPNASATSVDHLAFSIAKEDFDSEFDRLKLLGHELSTAYHEWVQWRSLYLHDPEGNLVELVCFDPDERVES